MPPCISVKHSFNSDEKKGIVFQFIVYPKEAASECLARENILIQTHSVLVCLFCTPLRTNCTTCTHCEQEHKHVESIHFII